ncbi:protocadherin Fat 1 isoform X2 [Brachionus plicatilis]|uniref:Protocadherin Fat 1 isoform X2 n=1 Tax=Brachionus plicatilis TaxID=10195 RepID=A0A3M7T7T3_BRAPC|nr:protocadherin Fat 1 isoform X2 [Brachionus plicatilis]
MIKNSISLLAILLLSQFLVLISAQSCLSDQKFDLKLNRCIPNIDCINELDDDAMCSTLDCSIHSDKCPKKCFCLQPSALTNYCMPCLNGGILNTTNCKCTCSYGFQGPRCQYQPDPCQAKDDLFCSNVNCFNSSDSDFFKCPVKCMCCKDKSCENLGKVVYDGSNCKCQCLKIVDRNNVDKQVYDPNNNCKLSNCIDDAACSIQFLKGDKVENCKNQFVKTLCPKSCGACQ